MGSLERGNLEVLRGDQDRHFEPLRLCLDRGLEKNRAPGPSDIQILARVEGLPLSHPWNRVVPKSNSCPWALAI